VGTASTAPGGGQHVSQVPATFGGRSEVLFWMRSASGLTRRGPLRKPRHLRLFVRGRGASGRSECYTNRSRFK